MKSDLIALLRTVAGMATKVHWGIAPQEEDAPFIVCTRVYAEPVNNLDGADGMTISRVQVDCWAETPLAAENLLLAAEAKLDTWFAGGAGATPAAPAVYGCARLGRNPDDYDEITKRHRASADFSIHHE